jgi:uncharacterized protein
MPAKKKDTLDIQQGIQILTELTERMALARSLGKSYHGDRDLYEDLGWKVTLEFKHYMNMFKRNPLGRAGINRAVSDCWCQFPDIYDNDDDDTNFDIAVKELLKQHKLQRLFSKADRLASIGQYAVILLGLSDGFELSAPAVAAKELLYAQRYSQGNATIFSYDEDRHSPRFSLPEIYTIQTISGLNPAQGTISTSSINVHHSRVIHICEDGLDNDIFSMPKLEAAYNALQSLELITGGSAEMFWRGAFFGLAFVKDPDVQIADPKKMVAEIERYVHSLSRYMNLEGVDPKTLAPAVADPLNHAAIQIDQIAAALQIPKRILMGSERGELASGQDEVNWRIQMSERRTQYCNTMIIYPFFRRLVEFGVLPEPKSDIIIEWPDTLAPTDDQRATVGKTRTEAVAAYANSIGAQDILPLEAFLSYCLGLSDDQIKLIQQQVNAQQKQADGVTPGQVDEGAAE